MEQTVETTYKEPPDPKVQRLFALTYESVT